jgi:hypothetical protein
MQQPAGFSTLGTSGDHPRHTFSLAGQPQSLRLSVLRADVSDTFPSPVLSSLKPFSRPAAAYPAGKGSNSIRRSMAPNSRRVK